MQNTAQYTYNVDASTDKFEIKVDTTACYGYFEHNTLGDGCGGGLWFDTNRELTDYDGVACLPMSVAKALRQAGFVVGEDFA